jgi:hypothetical protein
MNISKQWKQIEPNMMVSGNYAKAETEKTFKVKPKKPKKTKGFKKLIM